MPGETGSPKYLTAAEAAARLGVHRSTLYAYVSRGQVRAEADPKKAHASRYLTADVDRLRDRKQARLHPGDAARKTLHFGLPVMQSAITLIENGRLFYRGHDALELARSSTFEDAIGILWQDAGDRPRSVQIPAPVRTSMRRFAPADRLQVVLPFAAHADRRAAGSSSRGAVASGSRIMHALVFAATLRTLPRRMSIAAHLANAWHARHAKAIDLIDAALILCADHELNVSAFAVRVAASAGASLYDAILAGLCALRGARHGGQTDLVEDLLDESSTPDRLPMTIERRIARGDHVPGFGHPLYPDGDPRSRLLCELIAETLDARWVEAVQRAGLDVIGEFPTVDVGLVLLRRALRLPRGSAFLLFALGRSAGWIAHAMEQYASPHVIRPRALYSGVDSRIKIDTVDD